MRSVSRKERQERTRSCLMTSAAKVFSRRGLERASVDEIAEDAGYTKGAFYSNFKSKEELFLAMLDERFGREIERLDQALGTGEAPDEAARHAGEDFIRFMRSDPEWQRLFFEFSAHAARNEEFREELLTRYRAMRERLTEVFRRWAQGMDIEPPIPMEQITLIMCFMSNGFLLEQLVDPELDEELYGTAIATFMLGLRELGRQQDPEAVQRADERFSDPHFAGSAGGGAGR